MMKSFHVVDLAPLDRLLSIMARLRDPDDGCEWDCAQTFATIAPYTIEEAYEVADAIKRNAMDELRDELGDLLLQVVFHARMAEEAGQFDFADVAESISDKMQRRHPHVFGNTENPSGWEALKAAERSVKRQDGALDGVAVALPALLRAEKLQKRAARVGFDWPDVAGPRAKIFEEIEELEAESQQAAREEEAGDLLFAVVNYLRKQEIAPENALRAANDKFSRRFAAMERLAEERSQDFAGLDLDTQEALWAAIKRLEAQGDD